MEKYLSWLLKLRKIWLDIYSIGFTTQQMTSTMQQKPKKLSHLKPQIWRTNDQMILFLILISFDCHNWDQEKDLHIQLSFIFVFRISEVFCTTEIHVKFGTQNAYPTFQNMQFEYNFMNQCSTCICLVSNLIYNHKDGVIRQHQATVQCSKLFLWQEQVHISSLNFPSLLKES